MTHQEVRMELRSWIIKQGHKSLSSACEKANVNYRIIDNMLNGRTEIKLPMINELVENLNGKFCIKLVEGKPLITRR